MKLAKLGSDSPRYVGVAEVIGRSVKSGELEEHQALPSERELAEKYQVSRDTIRKAVKVLQEQGVIYSVHGQGNYVSPEMVRGMARFIESFSEHTSRDRHTPGQRILEIGPVPATLATGGALNVPVGRILTRVHRVRLVDAHPVGIQDAYFVLPADARVSAQQLERAGSVYRLLEERFGFSPAEAVENLSATIANAQDAAQLGIEAGVPLLVCERLTLSDRREPIEYCLMKYIPSYRYSTRVLPRDRS